MLTNIVLILNNNSFLSEEEDNFKRERSTGDSPVRVKTLKKINDLERCRMYRYQYDTKVNQLY